jgi:hypothetical protein
LVILCPASRREAPGRASVRRRGSRAAAVKQTALDGWLWTWAMTAGGIRIRTFGAVGGSLVPSTGGDQDSQAGTTAAYGVGAAASHLR